MDTQKSNEKSSASIVATDTNTFELLNGHVIASRVPPRPPSLGPDLAKYN